MATCYANPEALIEPDWLAEHLADEAIRVTPTHGPMRAATSPVRSPGIGTRI
jgi:hypothetical protein